VTASAAPGRSVLWVTLESVRQDRTSLAGADRPTTPTLAALADRPTASASARCYSHDVWTRASTASILTGLPSSGHRTWHRDAKLAESIATVPEAFRTAGYRTIGVSGNPQFSAAAGLDRGFETFDDVRYGQLLRVCGPAALARYVLQLRRHSAGFTTDTVRHSKGYLLNRVTDRRFREAAADDRPAFVYVHHPDTHHPYVPPQRYRDRFLPGAGAEAVDATVDVSANLHERVAEGLPLSDREWRWLEGCYDATLAYVDELIGDLIERARERLDDPIVVVTADHGEFLGEHGLLAHMLATDPPVANVPLVVDGLPALPDDEVVQHADVMATLGSVLDVDLDVPAGIDYRTGRPYAVTERGPERAAAKLEAVRDHEPAYENDRLSTAYEASLFDAGGRYRTDPDWEGVRRIAGDDTGPSTGTEPAPAASDWFAAWRDRHGEASAAPAEASFSTAVESQLRDLGYL